VRIFTADIIYHLTDQFSLYVKEVREERKRKAAADAVFPCIIKIIPSNVFNTKNPLVVGVDVLRGQLMIGGLPAPPRARSDSPSLPSAAQARLWWCRTR
jgi:translation initiation factor 5B